MKYTKEQILSALHLIKDICSEKYKKFLPLKKYHTVHEIRQNWSFDTVKIIIG